MQTRKNCRSIHKELRNQMPFELVEEYSRLICERLRKSDWYKDCTILYGYYPLEKEVDCRELLKEALTDGKRVALPRCGEKNQMDFYEIKTLSQVEEGRFHVMEPRPECKLLCEENAVVLVPGVVFDKCGNRFGYGKGYYDRYFSRYPKLLRFALAYEHQMEAELETLKTDVSMHCIYTEKSCYRCSGF